MNDLANTDTAAQNNTQAEGTGTVGAEGSTETSTQQSEADVNISAQEQVLRQKETSGEIPNREEAAQQALKTETEDKGIFSETLADKVADAAEGKAAESKATEGIVYTDFNMPEGVNLNEGAMKDFIPMAQEAGLTQEQAQKFVDIGGRLAEESMTLQEAAHEKQVSEWSQAAFEHPDLGNGSREAYKEAMAYADKALMAFGDKDLARTLMETGLVHNPSLLLYFKKSGQAISEDTLITSRRQGKSQADQYRDMYPASPEMNF